MKKYKMRVACYFDIEVEDENLTMARANTEMDYIQNLIDLETDESDQRVTILSTEEV